MAVPASQVKVWARPSHIRLADTDEATPSSAIVRQQSAVAAITARARGAATRLLAVSGLQEFQALVVGRGAGLRRGRDLRDGRIGLPVNRLQSGAPRAHALRGAIAVLESEGLFFRHVQWVDLPPAEAFSAILPGAYSAEFAALENGSVDAIYVRGPAGLEATRAAGARALVDIGAHRDPWIRTNTALLQVITACETLLPGRVSLDQAALAALDTLKTFLLRWAFIATDFKLGEWAEGHRQI